MELTPIKKLSNFLQSDTVRHKFSELLGKRSASFLSSVITAVNQNELLKNATPESVYSAALMAATLDLPINQNLGFAYLIPYNNKKTGMQECQFQIGYKGLIQLAQRSGQFKIISATPIYEGQILEENPLTGYKFNFSVKGSKIVGFASYFSLINGFENTHYMSIEQLQKHGVKYSQTYKKGYGLWKDDFESMAIKTVLKLSLAKFAPLSVDMQKAVIADHAVINNVETLDVDYVDNTPVTIEQHNNIEETKRLIKFIESAKTIDQLEQCEIHIDKKDESNEITKLFNQKLIEINGTNISI